MFGQERPASRFDCSAAKVETARPVTRAGLCVKQKARLRLVIDNRGVGEVGEFAGIGFSIKSIGHGQPRHRTGNDCARSISCVIAGNEFLAIFGITKTTGEGKLVV